MRASLAIESAQRGPPLRNHRTMDKHSGPWTEDKCITSPAWNRTSEHLVGKRTSTHIVSTVDERNTYTMIFEVDIFFSNNYVFWVASVPKEQAGCTILQKWSLPSKETLRGHSDSSFRGEGYIQCCVPHVLVNRLTGQAYTNFLENTIPHVLEDTPLINRQHIHF
ncbi:hypothetical protein ANN_27000 [Periplaneta americana]|uniref:Uncharacterized protein n=1 Tax=Periplaneta americana TaxID=6978 RepID=A0ABQ8RWU2_PERAM|nr:hypothetical protein ANN_27000 [Periplaneta americana]